MAKSSQTARVRQYLLENPEATTTEVAERFDVPKQTVYVARSLIKKQGGGRQEEASPKRKKRRVTKRRTSTDSTNSQAPVGGVLEGLAALAKAHGWEGLDSLSELISAHGWDEVQKAFGIVKEVQRGLQ